VLQVLRQQEGAGAPMFVAPESRALGPVGQPRSGRGSRCPRL